MSAQANILEHALQAIENDDLHELQCLFECTQRSDAKFNYEYMFQRVYLKAVLFKRAMMLEWLLKLHHELFDPTSKAALKSMFLYAKYLNKPRN